MAVTTEAVSAPKAGFWIRTVAYIVDAIIVSIVVGVLVSLTGRDLAGSFAGSDPAGSGINLVVSLAYFLFFWSSYGNGQTLGMRIFKLKVVKTDGSALSPVNALVRFVGLFISFAVVLIGVIWVAFDAKKQGWHDKIAGTYVLKAA